MTAASRLRSIFGRGLRQASSTESRFDAVVVVFTRSDRAIARLDIATGPCVALPGRKRPLVGVTNQRPGEPSRYEALHRVLVDPAPDPWASVVCSGPGCLRRFGDAFVAAMADQNRENLRRQRERPGDYDWIFEPERAVLRRWMPSVAWPVGASYVPSEASEMGALAAWARIAEERRDGLYCWSGPGFNPWTTPERINRYRASSGKRVG